MRFALITEGISEHRIIRHLLEKYFKEQAPYVRQIQPEISNNKQSGGGGWLEVLKYCKMKDGLRQIFINSDYLIIQIDTDQSQTKPFSISHTNTDNSLKSVNQLHSEVVTKLQSLISDEIMAEYGHQILFAISVHTIECWLLPLFSNNTNPSKTTSCVDKLNALLRRDNIHPISAKDKNNATSIKTYEAILKRWDKKRDIISCAQHNPAFKNFIDSLIIIEQ